MIYLFVNVYWCLRILKLASLSNANTQSPEIIAYLLIDFTTSWMSLCTGRAVYNHIKMLTTGEYASVLGQKNLKLTEGLECFKLYLDFHANTYRT